MSTECEWFGINCVDPAQAARDAAAAASNSALAEKDRIANLASTTTIELEKQKTLQQKQRQTYFIYILLAVVVVIVLYRLFKL